MFIVTEICPKLAHIPRMLCAFALTRLSIRWLTGCFSRTLRTLGSFFLGLRTTQSKRVFGLLLFLDWINHPWRIVSCALKLWRVFRLLTYQFIPQVDLDTFNRWVSILELPDHKCSNENNARTCNKISWAYLQAVTSEMYVDTDSNTGRQRGLFQKVCRGYSFLWTDVYTFVRRWNTVSLSHFHFF